MLNSFKIPHKVYAWTWTPSWLQRSQRIITEENKDDVVFAHFSNFIDGEQKSWLWLFPNSREAVQVATLPKIPGTDEIPGIDLIGATLPREVPNEPPPTELWKGPVETIINQDDFRNEFDWIWFGFDWERFKKTQSLEESTLQLEIPEFIKLARRSTTV